MVRDDSDDATHDEPARGRIGRPSKYKPEYATQAEKLCLLGATDDDLSDFFKVTVRTIIRWKAEHAAFCHALKDAKSVADARVERSLYQRAVGYQTDSVKIFQYEGKEIMVPYRENVQPDVTACIFWLKNRKSAEWKDKKDVEGHYRHDHTPGHVPALLRVLAELYPGDSEGQAEEPVSH